MFPHAWHFLFLSWHKLVTESTLFSSTLFNEGQKAEAVKYLRIAAEYDPAVNKYIKECEMDEKTSWNASWTVVAFIHLRGSEEENWWEISCLRWWQLVKRAKLAILIGSNDYLQKKKKKKTTYRKWDFVVAILLICHTLVSYIKIQNPLYVT